MKSNFSDFRAFAEEVTRIEQAKRDLVAPASKLALLDSAEPTLVVGEEPFGLTGNGNRQLAEKMGIPWDYYQRTAEVPGLRAANVNAWLGEQGTKKHLLRTLDGRVRAVLSDRFKPMDNFALLDAVMPALKEEAQARDNLVMRAFSLTEDNLYLQVGFPLTTVPLVQPGRHEATKQALMAGLTFRNSETGRGKLQVRRTVWNLVCWNGLVAEEVLSMVHLGRELEGGRDGENGNIWSDDTLAKEIELVRSRARDIVRDAMEASNLEEFVRSARRAIGDEVARPVEEAVVEVTKHLRFPLTESESTAVAESVLEGGRENRNRWGLLNGINALAHVTESADRQYDLERLAADVLGMAAAEWAAVAN